MDSGVPYPPHEQAADRKSGRKAAKTWTPADPRKPDPPMGVRLICADFFDAVLAESQIHLTRIGEIDALLAAARVRLTAAEEAAGADATDATADAPLAIPARSATDATDTDTTQAEFQAIVAARRQRDAADRRTAAANARRSELGAARREVAGLDAKREGAEKQYRLIFARHATKGVRRIRTFNKALLDKHPLRDQLDPLDARCLDELDHTIARLSQLSPRHLTNGSPPAATEE